MAPDELSLACRLSGLTAGELWYRYVEIGGSRSQLELGARLAGEVWPDSEDRYLAVVADEALRDAGLRLLPPRAAPAVALVVDSILADDERGLRRAAAAMREARVHGTRLTALFERCARTREDARGVRALAKTVRRSGDVGGSDADGGC